VPERKKPTKLQSVYRSDFAKAIQNALGIFSDPAKKKAYEKGKAGAKLL
jgi:hypothetical protein